jgi:SAM-dependent methyltransferase
LKYAFLILPASNRVYGEASPRLTTSELAVFGERALGGRISEGVVTPIGGLPYVTFQAAEPLAERDLAFLANLSSVYALFTVEGPLLRPVPLVGLDRYSSDLLTILKYPGKTNEHFTKLLVNVTLLTAARPGELLDRRLAVLDPLCGRGTTLNQALMYGHDAAGVDVDPKDFDAYGLFLKTWLKDKRFKHTAESSSVARSGEHIGRRLDVRFATTKEAWKTDDVTKLTLVQADTLRCREFFRPASFDVVVTDAPYGVLHGSHAESALSRRPLELLREAVPIWVELLRPGGALGISWNTVVAKREQVVAVLAASGLEVPDAGAYRGFSHRVDQAIVRDLVVGRK